MRAVSFAAFAFASAIAATGPAQALTLEQAKAQCRAEHGGRGGVSTADRTGVTVAQQIQRCVKAKMGGKKK